MRPKTPLRAEGAPGRVAGAAAGGGGVGDEDIVWFDGEFARGDLRGRCRWETLNPNFSNSG